MDPITIGLALAKFAPTVIGWIAGDDAEEKAKGVVKVAEDITGLSGMDAVSAIEADPKLALEFEQSVRQHQLEVLKVHAGDRDSARAQQTKLAEAGHRAAYAPAILSIIVTFGFFTIVWVLLKVAIPEASGDIIFMLLGTLAAGFTQVLNFWLGSSRSSQQKTALMSKS